MNNNSAGYKFFSDTLSSSHCQMLQIYSTLWRLKYRHNYLISSLCRWFLNSYHLHTYESFLVSLLKEQRKTRRAETVLSQESRHVASGSPPGIEPQKSRELHDVSFLKWKRSVLLARPTANLSTVSTRTVFPVDHRAFPCRTLRILFWALV